MAEISWSNPLVSSGSSYGQCPKANEVPPVPSNPEHQNPTVTAWASPSSLANNNERERERDRQLQTGQLAKPARPYPPSAWGAEPYAYPPARPIRSISPVVLQRPIGHQLMARPFHVQHQLLGQQPGQPVGQLQQPLISSFGPAGPSPSPPAIQDPNRRPGDWDCPACFAHNFASRSECFKCKYMKPGGITRRPGDWWCGKCNGHNYAYRVDCFKCGADKADGLNEPNTNVGPAERGRWAGDWDCPNCNANCFGSRMECFKCGEPKPVDLSTDN